MYKLERLVRAILEPWQSIRISVFVILLFWSKHFWQWRREVIVSEGKIILIGGLIFETSNGEDGLDGSQRSHHETYRNGYIQVRQARFCVWISRREFILRVNWNGSS